jgi:hypothetical protein
MQEKRNIPRRRNLGKAAFRVIGKTARLLTALLSLSIPVLCSAVDAYSAQIALVIGGKEIRGNLVEYSYSEDRQLMRARVGGVGINYSYSSRDSLLAYATTDTGFIYTVSRDRIKRMSQIVGANAMRMNVTYKGDSVVPSKIQIVKENGQAITPYDQSSVTNSTYSIRSIDQRLSQIYDAYLFADCMATKCPWED